MIRPVKRLSLHKCSRKMQRITMSGLTGAILALHNERVYTDLGRQWLVRRFELWDTELPDIEQLLVRDIRNNSAWNHRYFVVFGRAVTPAEETITREIKLRFQF